MPRRIDGILSLFENEKDYEFAFASTSPSPNEVAEQISKKQIDVLITDVMMPSMSGNEFAKKVRHSFPNIKILALSNEWPGGNCRRYD